MSTFAICPQCPNELFPIGLQGNSPSSKDVQKFKNKLLESLLDIAAPILVTLFFGKNIRVLKNIKELINDALEEYGESECPLTYEALKNTMVFLLLMPNDIPLPQLDIEESGDITLEWYKDKWNLYTVIIDESGLYYYAGLFGDSNNRDYGRKQLSDGIDSIVIQQIKRVCT